MRGRVGNRADPSVGRKSARSNGPLSLIKHLLFITLHLPTSPFWSFDVPHPSSLPPSPLLPPTPSPPRPPLPFPNSLSKDRSLGPPIKE